MKKGLLALIIGMLCSFLSLLANAAPVVMTALQGNASSYLQQGTANYVVFGFSLYVPPSQTFNPGTLSLSVSQNLNGFYSQIRLMKVASADPSLATSGTSVGANISANNPVQVNSFPSVSGGASGVTNYYYLVFDMATSTNTVPSSFTFSLPSSQSGYSGAANITVNNLSSPTSYTILTNIYWKGGASGAASDWGTSGNWAKDTQGNGIGRVPNSGDNVIIGSISYNNQPVISSSTSVGGIILDTSNPPSNTISLAVNGNISVASDVTVTSGGGNNTSCFVSLTGTKNMTVSGNFNLGDLTSPSTHFSFTGLTSTVSQLNISGNIILNSIRGNSQQNFDPTFNVGDGSTTCKVTASGISTTFTNQSSNTNTLIVNAQATLNLTGATSLSGLESASGGTNVITFNTTGATVGYTGTVAQTVYTDAAITGLATGPSYANLAFSGSGIKTPNTGTLNIAGNFTNSLANDASNYLSLSSNTPVLFNGTTQTLAGGSGNGTQFYNVTFSGAGTKTMSSGSFSVASTGLLTMSGSSASTVLAAGGLLTLLSNASGSAAVGAINGPSITGNVNVQRYVAAQTAANGGAADYTRSYRLMTSPISSNGTSTGTYTLSYLSTAGSGIFTSGPTSGGFTYMPSATANSTVYLYLENVAASNSSFNSGNFKGVNNLAASSTTVGYSTGSGSSTTSLYPGNGFMVYYVGNNISNASASSSALNKAARYNGNYIKVDASTATATGVLNQGTINVHIWRNNSTTLDNTQTGYNLVGNPYPCTINWDNFSNLLPTASIYGSNVSSTIYMFDYTNKNYATYTAGLSGTGNGSKFIGSGQGFFVKVTSPVIITPTITFKEAAKSTASPNFTSSLLMGVPVATAQPQFIKLRLAKDSINTDEAIIAFETDSKNEYESNRDAVRLNGIGNVSSLGTYSQNNNTLLVVNRMHNIDSTTHVKVFFSISGTPGGIDTLSGTGFETLDPRYDAFLIDHYKKDSLQISLYKRYNFNITSDTASYGANRFELAFHKKPGLNYRLLSFTGMQVKDGIQLTWRVENEQNLTGFSVQKADGSQQFISIYGMQSDGRGTYTWTDKAPSTGANTYRLQQNDPFETISYSKPITVTFDNNNTVAGDALTVYPNPTVSDLNVKLNNSSIPNQVLVKVFDSSGQLKLNKVTDGNHIQENIGNLLPGVYVVQILDNATQTLVGQKKITKAK